MNAPSDRETPVGSASSIHKFVVADPDRIAITHGEVQLTFRELDALVDATAAELATALEKAPLPAGSFIPVLVGRDIPSVILIHAGFRVGVPIGLLDAALPAAELADRLAALGQFGVALIHDESCADAVLEGTTIIRASHRPGGRIESVAIDPDGDALVVFSSGSTGRAKGVVHSRQVLTDLILDPVDKMLTVTSGPAGCIAPFHWIAGWNIAAQLRNGQSMVILDLGTSQPITIIKEMRTTKVAWTILPSSLALWLAHNNPGLPLADLEHLVLGGDPVTTDQIDELGPLIGSAATVEIRWGASEARNGLRGTSIGVENGDGSIPFHPLVDGSIRLEPSDDDPAPVYGGVVGEIIVRGDLAKRYLGQPELTALRFGVDPDGVRFWRSGDLAEQLPDGTLFLRGRIDDMVKINGKLVEPAESLALLRAYPGLRSVEVLPHTYASGRIVLVAHVVADDNVSPDAVRQMLMNRLPVHVIPGVVMRHDRLPLTDRGKVDRQTLQKLQPVAWLETDTRAAGSELETYLLGQLRAILETDGIGVDDDIWFVGLDSLGATELVASIADIGLGELAPTVLLEHRTIRSLARQLRDGIDERSTDIVTFNAETPGDPFFCITGGGGTAIRFQPLADCFSTERPLVVIEAHGMHTRGKPDRTITAMAQRVTVTAKQLQPTGTITLLGHSAGGLVAWAAAQQLVDDGRHARVVLFDTYLVRGDVNIRIDDWGPAPPGMSRTRRIVRANRLRLASLKRRWWERHPGAPRADPLRYMAFNHIMVRAFRRHEIKPARFPVLYLPVRHQSNPDEWHRLATNLTITTVDGDHQTMLDNQNVAKVASIITQWIDSPAGSAN